MPVIGIDLGTTNSCVAVLDKGQPVVVINNEGSRTTPSVVGYTQNDTLIGMPAKRQAITNPTNTIHAAKRLIGRKADSPDIAAIAPHLSYALVSGPEGDAWIDTRHGHKAPEQISADILRALKHTAEFHLGQTVSQAVITVPAYFTDAQRQATKDAAQIAGLHVLRILNEPTAAALAYGLEKKENKKIAIYDLGGGTFDITILDLREGVFEVLSTNGDTLLGGEDFDNAIARYLTSELQKERGVVLDGDSMARQRVNEAAEKAKIELSSAQSTSINLPFLSMDPQTNTPVHFSLTLTRTKLEALAEDLIARTLVPCRQALRDAGLSRSDIAEVVLVGGMTRMPRVMKAVEEFFGKAPRGNVNPDEVVAMGAAIQAGILEGDIKDVVLLDVTPLTLGIETKGGLFAPLIERNTTVPTKKTEIFSTAMDHQTEVQISVFQGERSLAQDNTLLAKFTLSGIVPAPRGVPQIAITFDIDADGITHVSAKDKATGRQQKITIKSRGGLTQESIDQIIQDAALAAQADQESKDLIIARNHAEEALYTANQHAPLPDEIQKIYEALVNAMEQTDRYRIEHHTQALLSRFQDKEPNTPGEADAGKATS